MAPAPAAGYRDPEAGSDYIRRMPPFFKRPGVSVEKIPERRPRADSLRNRDQLLAAAKQAFAEIGAEAPLEEIARRAGLGIGTLYRHFPTRDALLAAVYQRELGQLCAAADALIAERPAGEALATWLNLLVDYMATKRVIAPALQASTGDGRQVYAASMGAVSAALERLADAAREGGAMRPDITAQDLQRLMAGLTQGYDQPGWAESARRLIGVLVAGLRP